MATLAGLGQVSRTVSDIKRSEAWYRDKLGLQHLYTFGPLAFFDVDGTRLMLSAEAGASADESVLYFQVDDIQAAVDELTRRGVEFRRGPQVIHTHQDGTEEWMAFFDDPDGRLLALMTRTRTASPHRI